MHIVYAQYLTIGEYMKSVTEFFSHKLVKGIDARTALAAEGKSPEEIESSIGESFKFEGDKLKHFINSMDLASENIENLTGVQVVTLAENESAPEKSKKIEDFYYIPEFRNSAPAPKMGAKKSKSSGKKDQKSGPRPSPWGMSPEEEAAKKLSSKNTALTAKSKKD